MNKTMMREQNIPPEVFDYVSSILESNTIVEIWDRWNPTQKEQNPGPQISHRLKMLKKTMSDVGTPEKLVTHKDHLSFMRQLVEWQRTNLGKSTYLERRNTPKTKQEKRNRQRNDADKVAGILRDILPDSALKDYDLLQPPQKELLRTLKKHTAQRTRILTDFKEKSGELGHHIWKNIKTSPVLNAAILAIAFPASAYLTYEGYQITDTKLAIEETCTVNASATDLFLNPDYKPEIDMKSCNSGYRSCHDEIKSTLPTLAAFLEENNIRVPDLPHCTTVNSFTHEVQQKLVGATDLLSSILYTIGDIFADDYIDAAKKTNFFKDSYFLQGAEMVSEPLQKFLNLINRAENSIHIPLGLIFLWLGINSVARARKMTSEEWDDFKKDMAEIWNAATVTHPLNFAIPTASAAYYLKQFGYDSSQTIIDQNLMIIAIGGAISGSILHRLDTKFRKNTPQAFRIADKIPALSTDFHTNSLPLSQQLLQERPERLTELYKRSAKYGAALAGYATVVTADISGFITSMPEGMSKEIMEYAALGAGMVPTITAITIPSVFYNFIIEDPAQHIAFIGGGYTIGATAGTLGLGTILATKFTIDYINNYNKNDSPSDPNIKERDIKKIEPYYLPDPQNNI